MKAELGEAGHGHTTPQKEQRELDWDCGGILPQLYVDELQAIARRRRLNSTGPKRALVERLSSHFGRPTHAGSK